MARPPAASWLADLCAYLGLKNYQLAQYLHIDPTQLSRLASGERLPNMAVEQALAPLVALLPAASEAAPAPGLLRPASAPPEVPALAPPEAAPLEARLDECRHRARQLRRQLAPLQQQATAAARWAAALPGLRAALPPDPATEPDPATDWPAWLTWHRHRWLAARPTRLPPDLSARYHLLRLRAEALEAEAAALAGLLAG
ncbi:helix-turn-helix domain-containing protein [Hymenobacter sp. NST-14]|uniref:helix-turn-helix transcriptional regulator n=1 Tax=Hymenobacter piscis TaxID=2839984 RepID=UPI001C0178A5|nr:helix-turn-helix transcriptional regulator [Hymenobacter piscis]MBT9394318.1 helix-turn-helix domain-containing protein [Hymenobacter piscis]